MVAGREPATEAPAARMWPQRLRGNFSLPRLTAIAAELLPKGLYARDRKSVV